MKTLFAILILVPSLAFAVTPTLTFDNPTLDGGAVAYDGLGGAFVATDVLFQLVVGVDTPANSGVPLYCSPTPCLLDFTTGNNLTEGPPIYTWAGGGALALVGGLNTAADGSGTQISPAGTLLAHDGVFNSPAGVLTGGTNLLFVGIGSDLKDVTLTDFYGVTGSPLTFATTALSLDQVTLDANGGFTAVVNDADFANAVPEPATLLLLGTGLVGVALAAKRRGAV